MKNACVAYKSVPYKKTCMAYKNVAYKCVWLIKVLHIKRCVVVSTNIRNSQVFFFLKFYFELFLQLFSMIIIKEGSKYFVR